jgi:exodeoxyribonuclease-3
MRITTWNINGLRAGLNKGLLDILPSLDADIFCLQEIKARPEQLDPASMEKITQQYPYVTWNPAVRPGYSGTSTWARLKPDEMKTGLGFPEFDNEGRVVISCYPDFWLFNIYFPNGQNDLGRVPYKLDFYAHLLELCDTLHTQGQGVILCGDFNTSHQSIDLKHPKANEKSTGFLPEERAWIDTYLNHRFVDIFRKRYPERVEYTWWTFISNARARNVGWRLDYFLISDNLEDRVVDVIHHQDIMGSDHCPVTLVLTDQPPQEAAY